MAVSSVLKTCDYIQTADWKWSLTPEPWPGIVLESGTWAQITPVPFLRGQIIVIQCTEMFLATASLTLILTTSVTSSGFE